MAVHVDISRALNQFKLNSQEVLESIQRKVLTRSCVRIRNYARSHHRRWDNRTGALEKAITYRFIRKWKEAEVYINQDRLNEELDKGANWIDPGIRFSKEEIEKKKFPRNSVFGPNYSFYPKWLIEGTQDHALPAGKTYRFIDKHGKLRFIRSNKGVMIKGIKGDDFLANARNRINIKDIIREVLSEYGLKST